MRSTSFLQICVASFIIYTMPATAQPVSVPIQIPVNPSEPIMQQDSIRRAIPGQDTPGPRAAKRPHRLEQHGDVRTDDYYWLNNRENPEVIKYLTSENEFTEGALLQPNRDLNQKLYDEIVARLKKDDSSVPVLRKGYWYYSRYEPGLEYPFYCRRKGSMQGAEEILLNGPELAKGKNYFAIGNYEISPDNKYIAYTVDFQGRRQHELFVKDLATNKTRAINFKLGGGDVEWANDSKHIFFTGIDQATLRYDKIYRIDAHKGKKAEVVYEEKDETFYYIGVGKTKDDKFLTIMCNSTISNETLILDANKPKGVFTPFEPRKPDHLYYAYHYKNKWFVLSNNKAKNFRLVETPDGQTGMANWKTVIGQRRDVLLEGIEVFDNHLVVQERSKALVQLRVIRQTDKIEHYVQFPEDAYDASLGYNPSMDTKELRFSYTSLTTPNSVYAYDLDNQTRVLLKEEPVLGKFDRQNYKTHRMWVKVSDGTEVPVTIVHHRATPLSGKTPLLLYAYGSYGSSTDPVFSSSRLSLLDRGFAFAIAHVRGGQEMGRQWYEDGKLLKKMNTFTDFNDVAQYLIDQNLTSPQHLYAMGGSAGGLLMGAIVNMAPQLYRGVIAAVPFVDVVTTMSDPTIPLTTAEYDEWGNPANQEYYFYMKSYSPYDNVVTQNYPALLVTTGLHDSQVQYWEPAKWVARLRDISGSINPIYLHTNMDAGHGGASGRYERHKQTALMYTFLLTLEGITE